MARGPLNGYDDEGILTINSIVMNCPAWAVGADDNGNNGLLQLWLSADKRGDDRVTPRVHGVRPFKRLRTGTRYDLNVTVTGDVTNVGALNADSQVGLATNLKYLLANIVDPGDATDSGTVSSSLVMWGSSFTATGGIHVLGIKPTGPYPARSKESLFNGIIQISVPAGRYA